MPPLLRWFFDLWLTNPIVVRLVQNGSKRLRHLTIRTAYLTVLSGALLWSLVAATSSGTLSYRDLAAAGARGFEFLAYLQVALICLLTPLFMAGAIAQEADPRTWSILLTTPLSAGQIILGNLLGRLFFVLALLFASLPLFAATQYFGGSPARAIFASYGVAGCATLFVGAVAITLTAFRLGGRKVVFGFYVGVVGYLAATWGADQLLRQSAGGVTMLTALNPFLALESLLSPSSYPTPEPTALAQMSWLARLWLGSPALAWCLWSTVASVALTAASSLAVRTIAGVEGARLGLRGRGRRRAPRTVWHNPVAWREGALRAGTGIRQLGRWGFLTLACVWALGMLDQLHRGQLRPDDFRFALLVTMIAELAIALLVTINLAATTVSREREDGSLDLLLTTPLTPQQYLSGKLRGVIAATAPYLAAPLGTIALASLYVLLGGLGETTALTRTIVLTNGATLQSPLLLPEAAVALPVATIPFFALCVMVCLQWSLKSKGTISSVVGAAAVISVVAGALGLCVWNVGVTAPVAGPALTMATPATAVPMLLYPEQHGLATLQSLEAVAGLRTSVLLGALGAALLYTAVTYALLSSMVRTFDTTVRRLAGTR
ncbi:MAG: hypothetical protein D6824_00875 [Planctomycetota bacterium]|nr:MAG: hypothetical protein D6824_00875 [Planctomycetota bacterium]